MFLFKQKTAYEMRISDWSSDVCSSDLARPDFELGAKVKPQLPMTAVVTPCQHDEDPKGSQCIWASRWVCPSMKPGVTTWPSASITCLALPETSPIAAMRPPWIATSARYPGRPEPSITVPLRRTRASIKQNERTSC